MLEIGLPIPPLDQTPWRITSRAFFINQSGGELI